jgi:hypothetical protein
VSENPIVLIVLVVIPCTYALALVALLRREYTAPRQVIRGRHITVATDARTVMVGSDAPRVVATSQGVIPVEVASAGWREPSRQLGRGAL